MVHVHDTGPGPADPLAGLIPTATRAVDPSSGRWTIHQLDIDVALIRGADGVCNAGAVIGYRSAPYATPGQVLADVGDKIGALIHEALSHPRGPLAGACERAAGFLRSWWGDPPGSPFAASQ